MLSFASADVLSVHIANLYINEFAFTGRLINSHQFKLSIHILKKTVVQLTSITNGRFSFFVELNFTSVGLESRKDVGFGDMTHFSFQREHFSPFSYFCGYSF